MPEPWDAHVGAVMAAVELCGEVQEHIATVTDLVDRAIGATLSATGATRVESARNAMEFLAGTKERVNECYGMVDQAAAELRRYAGGF